MFINFILQRVTTYELKKDMLISEIVNKMIYNQNITNKI